MPDRKLVFSWIGDADLLAWGRAVGGSTEQDVAALFKGPARKVEGKGPIKTLVDDVAFDELHLMTDKPVGITKRFAAWLGPRAVIHPATLKSPVDYEAIFESVDHAMEKVISQCRDRYELAIHLSSGTPAMTAIWVLLGKSRYPALFYQTYRDKVIPTSIPFDLIVDYLPGVLRRTDRALQSANVSDAATEAFGKVTGSSARIREVISRARRIALRDVGVLLLGESGVGKDVFARAVHETSPRCAKPFVAINCAAVPKDLLESELFGHIKGGFTGATADRPGAFEQADAGTLFLDEVGECDLPMQAKLLRVLQPGPEDPPTRRTFRRVGDAKDRHADVRIIAATNRDLQAEVAAGRFREDLYYRLATFILKIPALRERATDIPVIGEHLLARLNADFSRTEPGYQHKRLSASTKRFLAQQAWPGNVRQLQNALLQAAVMSDAEVLEPEDLEVVLAESPSSGLPPGNEVPLGDGFSLSKHLESIQRTFLARAMKEAGGSKARAAELLGYANYQTLAAQLDRLGVDWGSR